MAQQPNGKKCYRNAIAISMGTTVSLWVPFPPVADIQTTTDYNDFLVGSVSPLGWKEIYIVTIFSTWPCFFRVYHTFSFGSLQGSTVDYRTNSQDGNKVLQKKRSFLLLVQTLTSLPPQNPVQPWHQQLLLPTADRPRSLRPKEVPGEEEVLRKKKVTTTTERRTAYLVAPRRTEFRFLQ